MISNAGLDTHYKTGACQPMSAKLDVAVMNHCRYSKRGAC
jgi:hypothetical protein